MPLSTTHFSALLLALFASTAAPTVFAQVQDRDGALGFKLGETNLFPSIRIDYLQNSNAFLQPSDEISASDIRISPELVWVADRRLVSLEGSYKGSYDVSSEDERNYADHRLAFNADAELDSRKRVSGEISVDFGHEDLGTNLTRGVVLAGDEPVGFADFQAEGEYRYGAEKAKGNVSAGLLLKQFDYTSRSDVSSQRGFTQIEPFATFSLRLSGDTRLLSEIRYGSFRFENSQRDRDDLSLLAGLQFASTGKSGGEVRLGVLQSQEKRAQASDRTEFVMRASLFWEPTSFSRFDLAANRSLDNRGSSFVSTDEISAVEDVFSLRWQHSWSSRVSHIAGIQVRNLTRSCPDLNDNTLTGQIELNIAVRRWLSVGLSGSNTVSDLSSGCSDTENTDPGLDYERSLLGAYVRATL